jgi:hypothetical protein
MEYIVALVTSYFRYLASARRCAGRREPELPPPSRRRSPGSELCSHNHIWARSSCADATTFLNFDGGVVTWAGGHPGGGRGADGGAVRDAARDHGGSLPGLHPAPYQQLMVTRFAASLRTDISPQRKEARPLSHALTSDQYNFLTSRLCGLMVRRRRLIGYFAILYN